jgi:hypothetical protein
MPTLVKDLRFEVNELGIDVEDYFYDLKRPKTLKKVRGGKPGTPPFRSGR